MNTGELELATLLERLGLTPLNPDAVPGIARLRAHGAGIARVRPTRAYGELLARRQRDEISGEEFVTAVETLIAASPPESTIS